VTGTCFLDAQDSNSTLKCGVLVKNLDMRNNGKLVVVPAHHSTIPIGTLKSIENQSGLNFREIYE